MAIRDELVRELTSLRKGVGITVAKLKASYALLALMAVDETEAVRAIQVLRGVLDVMGEGRHVLALRAALAIDGASEPTLTKRREAFGATQDRLPDTVERWENQAIDELVDHILLIAELTAMDDNTVDTYEHIQVVIRALAKLMQTRKKSFSEHAMENINEPFSDKLFAEQFPQLIDRSVDLLNQVYRAGLSSEGRFKRRAVINLTKKMTAAREEGLMLLVKSGFLFGYRQAIDDAIYLTGVTLIETRNFYRGGGEGGTETTATSEPGEST